MLVLSTHTVRIPDTNGLECIDLIDWWSPWHSLKEWHSLWSWTFSFYTKKNVREGVKYKEGHWPSYTIYGDLYSILFLTTLLLRVWVYLLSLHFVYHSCFLVCFLLLLFSYTGSHSLHDQCRKTRTDQEAKRKQRSLIFPLMRNGSCLHYNRLCLFVKCNIFVWLVIRSQFGCD